MSLKQQIQTWSDALDAYEAQDFDRSIELFGGIADESKILFNIGLVQATIGSHELAVESFEAAIGLDQYLAVAYFQSGVSNFLLGRYEEARRDFDDAYSYLRANLTIDYEQLGLKFRLYSCEVLFNRGLSSIYMGQEAQGMADLTTAMKEKQTDEHGVIDEAYGDRGDGYTVFSIPVGILYCPSANKVKNLKTKNYLGSAKLVAATDSRDAFTSFTGSTMANGTNPGGNFWGEGGAGALACSKTSAARIEMNADAAPARRPPARSNTLPVGGGGGNLSRSATMPNGPRGPGAPARKKNDGGLPTPPPSDELAAGGMRDTTYLDSYYGGNEGPASPAPPVPMLPNGFGGAEGPTPEGQPIERVANWARQNAGAPPPQMSLSRSTSVNETGNQRIGMGMMRSNTIATSRAGGGGGGGRFTNGGSGARGYGGGGGSRVGGDLDYGYEGTVISDREMSKVRVKLRFKEDTRGMSISPEMRLEDFVERVRRKFESPNDLPMKYKDVDGALVSIVDTDDWESAIDEARENSKGRGEGKLEIWIS